MFGKPGRQIGRAAEVKQRLGESFQLLQWQGLDAGGGRLAQGAAATVEQAERQFGFTASFSFLAATSLTLLPTLFDPILGEPGVAQVIGGDVDQGHDFLASEMGKPLPQNRDNNLEQVGAGTQDLLGCIGDVGFRPHRQGEQANQRIKPRLPAELLQTQLKHASKKCLQLKRQFGRPQPEAPVGNHDDYLKVLHLGVQLQKAKALSCKTCLKPALPCICTSSSTTGCSGVPPSLPRGQRAPSRR